MLYIRLDTKMGHTSPILPLSRNQPDLNTAILHIWSQRMCRGDRGWSRSKSPPIHSSSQSQLSIIMFHLIFIVSWAKRRRTLRLYVLYEWVVSTGEVKNVFNELNQLLKSSSPTEALIPTEEILEQLDLQLHKNYKLTQIFIFRFRFV